MAVGPAVHFARLEASVGLCLVSVLKVAGNVTWAFANSSETKRASVVSLKLAIQ
jgi:hypothetical protein